MISMPQLKIRDCLLILSMLRDDAPVNYTEIRARTNLDKKQVRKAIDYLRENSLIFFDGYCVKINVSKIA